MATERPDQVTCPNCGRIISGAFVDSAASGEGSGSDSVTCECGHRITFWQATAQLRDQKKVGARIGNWFRSLFGGKG
jgi:hypothetical protein